MYEIRAISCVNLRALRDQKQREADSKFRFECASCKKKKVFGQHTFAFIRITYAIHGEMRVSEMCAECADVLGELIRFGPRSLSRKKTRTIRVLPMHEVRQCFNCLQTEASHVMIKYDNIDSPGRKPRFYTKRVCARCAISYLELLLHKEVIE